MFAQKFKHTNTRTAPAHTFLSFSWSAAAVKLSSSTATTTCLNNHKSTFVSFSPTYLFSGIYMKVAWLIVSKMKMHTWCRVQMHRFKFHRQYIHACKSVHATKTMKDTKKIAVGPSNVPSSTTESSDNSEPQLWCGLVMKIGRAMSLACDHPQCLRPLASASKWSRAREKPEKTISSEYGMWQQPFSHARENWNSTKGW